MAGGWRGVAPLEGKQREEALRLLQQMTCSAVSPDVINYNFMAISRVRALEHLALDEPMHQERLLKINRHKALPHRKRIV